MSRPLRIAIAGGLYHATSRGNRREKIYWDDADRQTWLDVVGKVCSRNLWRVHAWCQMSNHYHLVVETPEANLAQGMRLLNGVYTQRTNKRHKRCGHIFQGRYHAVLIERHTHLLELSRYVVLNPVRAGILRDPADWPWSSYAAMLGNATAPSWFLTQWLLAQFGTAQSEAVQRYKNFVLAGINTSPLCVPELLPSAAGTSEFVVAALALGRKSADGTDLTEVPRAYRRPPTPTLPELQARYTNRDAAIAQAYATGGYSMREIGLYFGLHRTTVAKTVRSFESQRVTEMAAVSQVETDRQVST